MNIFVTSPCPVESAEALDDKRVVKMVLESAQMLSMWLNERGLPAPYRATHRNHPCTQWVMQNNANAAWLYRHFVALCHEYTKRYGKIHKCALQPHWVPLMGLDQTSQPDDFVNCTTYRDCPVHVAYQNYLNDKWDSDKRAPTWYRR